MINNMNISKKTSSSNAENMHTFAICAYQESPYLEDCLISIIKQNIKTKVIMSTSTNNNYINELSKKYSIPLYINDGLGDMQDNWNFIYDIADTQFVTIVHQDDFYHPDYSKHILDNIKQNPNAIMLYTDYFDVINNIIIYNNYNHTLKRMLNSPMKTGLSKYKFFKKLSLSFGNPICCPSVTYNKHIISPSPFKSKLVMAVDWDLFYQLAKIKGTFVYINKPLIYKRIHEESETNESIQNGKRFLDDFAMFSKIWPVWFAKIISNFYKKCYSINNLGDSSLSESDKNL